MATFTKADLKALLAQLEEANVPDSKELELMVWDGNDNWRADSIVINDSYSSGIIELEMKLDKSYAVTTQKDLDALSLEDFEAKVKAWSIRNLIKEENKDNLPQLLFTLQIVSDHKHKKMVLNSLLDTSVRVEVVTATLQEGYEEICNKLTSL